MVPPPWRFHDALIKQQEICMTTTRELCRLLSATLHLPGVHRWAEQLGSRELLPGLDHEVYGTLNEPSSNTDGSVPQSETRCINGGKQP